jgi:mycothiol system anti-sigma-R factor
MQQRWGIKKIAETLGFSSKKKNMYDCNETLKHVVMALDGELSTEEEKQFLEHINDCSHCLEKYEIEKSFKKYLTEKISRHTIPAHLIDQIRSRILGKS